MESEEKDILDYCKKTMDIITISLKNSKKTLETDGLVKMGVLLIPYLMEKVMQLR